VKSAVKIINSEKEEESKEKVDDKSKFASPRTSQFTGINDTKANSGTFDKPSAPITSGKDF
jgi:hypothetical protein